MPSAKGAHTSCLLCSPASPLLQRDLVLSHMRYLQVLFLFLLARLLLLGDLVVENHALLGLIEELLELGDVLGSTMGWTRQRARDTSTNCRRPHFQKQVLVILRLGDLVLEIDALLD